MRRFLLILLALALPGKELFAQTSYIGSATTTAPTANILNTATEILGSGGGSGAFAYKGGGNAVDAAVATALAACVVNPGNASLGAYGGHIMIYKSGFDGEAPLITCINFDSAAGSLATSNMFVGSVNPVTGAWTNGTAQNQYGWKAVGVPGTLAGLYMAQTNYGRKVSGTNYFSFAEMLKVPLARIAGGLAATTSYYTTAALSNLVMELYTNSPGYRDANGNANPFSNNDPCALFYSGDIAQDIAAAMQANGGLVTYADLTNYRPREVTPYSKHFNYPGGTPATVYVAPPGSSGLSVLQEVAIMESLGWTNGPSGTWDGLHYWHGRAEAARLMWKDHFQFLGDPWSGVVPPDFLGNGSTNFCDQFLAHVTNGYPFSAPSDPTEILLTNSILNTIVKAVEGETNVPILVHWDDIRYGTRNITTCDKWGNCVAITFSMGGGYGAQVGVPSRGLVFGQGMSLFDTRPGWPNSIGPGKRQVDNMCPAIVVPDFPALPTSGVVGGRPPFAVGAAGGSTIENNVASQIIKYLTDPPSSRAASPTTWLYNFEANKTIYMRPSYPSGVQTYLASVGLSAPGNPPSTGETTFVEAFIAPTIIDQPQSANVSAGSTVTLNVGATGLPLFYQWLKNGIALTDDATVSGALTPSLTVADLTNSAGFSAVVFNGSGSVTSVVANVVMQGPPTISTQPVSSTVTVATPVTLSIDAVGAGPLSYQWSKNGTNVNSTSATFTIGSAVLSDSGTYRCVVGNSYGSVTSQPATLTVIETRSGLVLYEPFAYTNIGSPVSSNTPANWTYNGTGGNDLNVTSGSLSYAGLMTSMGNSVTNGGNGLGVRRLLGTNVNSGQFYFSALLRINDLGFGAWNGVSSQLGALTSSDNLSFRLAVMVKSNSPNGYVIGLQKGGSGAGTIFDSTERKAGDTVFLVGKYDFTITPNVVTLWINPQAATFGSPSEPNGALSISSGTDNLVIDRFNMRQNAATGASSVPANIQWDELRFGYTWWDVTPPAVPPAMRLLALSRSGNVFSASWEVTAGASYSFQYKNDLSEPTWQTITNTSPDTSTLTLSDVVTNSQRFYRLATGNSAP